MATLGLKEMGKFLWEGRESLPSWLFQFSFNKRIPEERIPEERIPEERIPEERIPEDSECLFD